MILSFIYWFIQIHRDFKAIYIFFPLSHFGRGVRGEVCTGPKTLDTFLLFYGGILMRVEKIKSSLKLCWCKIPQGRMDAFCHIHIIHESPNL